MREHRVKSLRANQPTKESHPLLLIVTELVKKTKDRPNNE
ncbi:hypothetical protein VCR4J5_1200002 [Vibrio crassostreae]|uniref:Uncharacterized protein n=1 Tax=Vibrio crassostreae TaxID=246167 RepID=A0ABP1WLV7_9VIBR|nr:hypothetical protein VCR4J5_1200002 [Vibrio crassostreae]